MASNNLTPEQDLITRRYFTEVLGNVKTDDPVGARRSNAYCLKLLGYTLVQGKFIGEDKLEGLTYGLGGNIGVNCEWDDDTRKVENEVKSNKGFNKDEANSSKPTKDTALWKAVFSKDL